LDISPIRVPPHNLSSEWGRYNARAIKQRRVVLKRTTLCLFYRLAEVDAPLSRQINREGKLQ